MREKNNLPLDEHDKCTLFDGYFYAAKRDLEKKYGNDNNKKNHSPS